MFECEFCGAQLVPENRDPFTKNVINAEVYLSKLNDKNEARRCFETAVKENPGSCCGWWGLVRILTDEFRNENVTEKEYREICGYQFKAFAVASEKEIEVMNESWVPYKEAFDRRYEAFEREHAPFLKQEEQIKAQIMQIEEQIKQESASGSGKENRYWSKITAVIILGIACLILTFLGCAVGHLFDIDYLIYVLLAELAFFTVLIILFLAMNGISTMRSSDKCNLLSQKSSDLQRECKVVERKIRDLRVRYHLDP